MKKLFYYLTIYTSVLFAYSQTSQDYYEVIKEEGQDPIPFIKEKLQTYDLLIFDDALHNAQEPFDFYKELLQSDSSIDYVFIEVFGINNQPLIDAYLASEDRDSTLLYPVFQNNFGGMGWQYETYFDLLKVVWSIKQLGQSNVSIIAVDQPIYWEGIHSRTDYNQFQKSLIGRDYFMYKTIAAKMDQFNGSKKGIFLTNTRHAYKNISNSKDNPYWNSGTFFYHWHPEKTYSIRFHNVTLSISARKKDTNKSIDGLDMIEYKWAKMDNGLWDHAFAEFDNKPVALPISNNVYGQTKYMGNHMLNVSNNQSMEDAYDALIFLKPIEELHSSAKTDFFYTDTFKLEMKRRLNIIYENNVPDFLQKNDAKSLEEYIEAISQKQPAKKNKFIE